jgi:acyl CoA:acetate/3-ketoacid CoA transferase alpha subunit
MDILQSGAGELIQPFDLDEFREWNRTQKSRKLVDKMMSEQEAVSRFVYDGCYIGTELYGTVRAPMSLTREVIRQNKKDLRVCGQGVLELDLWLAAGLVKELDITYIGLEVYGTSSALRRAVESGQVEKCVEWSNGAITWRMKAAAMGVPFLPTRSMLGTDTLYYSAAKVVEDPFTGAKVALLPALVLDVALIHVHRADKYGNCQIEGISGCLQTPDHQRRGNCPYRGNSRISRPHHHPLLPGGCGRACALRLVSRRDGLPLWP